MTESAHLLRSMRGALEAANEAGIPVEMAVAAVLSAMPTDTLKDLRRAVPTMLWATEGDEELSELAHETVRLVDEELERR